MSQAAVFIQVCIGSSCHIKGSYDVISSLQALLEEDKITSEQVDIAAVFCMGNCKGGVCLRINEGEIHNLTPTSVEDFYHSKIKTLL